MAKALYELSLTDQEKRALAFLIKARTTEEVAAKLEESYSSISQKLKVWKARGLIVNSAGSYPKRYQINLKKVVL